MIKFTAFHYKIKIASLERFHKIKEHNEGLMFEWGVALEKSKSLGLENGYPEKPFIEPFEFEQEDYVITEKKFRLRLIDILFYKENDDGITELTTTSDVTFTLKETVEEIDKFFKEN